METWLVTSLILCSYGFFKELRPSEPFLTEYLLGPYHNLTESEVYYDVYPVWTYSYLSLLIVVFLVTDILRYKPVIVFEGIGYVATWALLLWAGGVHWMQMMEFCYGIATSTEVAYYTYIYAQVDPKHYQKVTSYTRTAILSGRFCSAVLAQVLASTGLMNYHSLNYISLASVIIALVIALCLPPVKTSIYFHREEYQPPIERERTLDFQTQIDTQSSDNIGESTVAFYPKKNPTSCQSYNFKQAGRLLWTDFRAAYSNKYLLKWSFWWAFATCVSLQVGNYVQPLWESVAPFQEQESIYNGAAEAASTLLGALAAFGVGYVHLNWTLLGELVLAIISLTEALLLIFMGLTSNIWVAYINYVAFCVSYQVLITVASYQVAKELKAESYGLVFGMNMFLALLLQCILTVIVIEWLQLEPGTQFVVYGGYFGFLSFVFFLFSYYGMGKLGFAEIRRQGLKERKDIAADVKGPLPEGGESC